MSRSITAYVSGALLLAPACTPSPNEPAQVPAPALSLPDAPAAPEHGLPTVAFGKDWSPSRAVAGDVAALRAALEGAGDVVALVEPRLASPGQIDVTQRALEELAPVGWSVEARPWEDAIVGVPSLQRTDETSAPRYATTGLSMKDSISRMTLVLGDAPIDLTAWRALPASSSGSCQPVFDPLALGQEQSLAYVEPFLDHADTVLRLRFRAELSTVIDALRADVAPFASPEPAADASVAEVEAHACGRALFERVQEASACLHGDSCALAPRVVLRGGIAVAMPAPAWAPGDCPERVPLDVLERITEAATEATVATVSQLEPQWVTLADRVGAMGAVYEALHDVCSPRRRRFALEDLADARARLGGVERALGSEVLDEAGQWDMAVGSLFVPGSGPMTSVARFVPAPGSASQTAVAEAKGVRRFLLSRSLCRSGFSDRPLAVALFEPGRSDARFVGFVYEETLVCADLPLAG